MSTTEFRHIKNGELFKHNHVVYEKVPTVFNKGECCPEYNATSDVGKAMFGPKQPVEAVVKVKSVIVEPGKLNKNDDVFPDFVEVSETLNEAETEKTQEENFDPFDFFKPLS